MITFGQQMQGIATNLISKYGDSQVTFTRIIPGTFIPSTGGMTTDSTLTYISQGLSSSFTSQEVNNTTVLFGDLKYLIKVSTQIPQVNDTVILDDTNTYRVISVLNTSVQDTDICYTLQLRI